MAVTRARFTRIRSGRSNVARCFQNLSASLDLVGFGAPHTCTARLTWTGCDQSRCRILTPTPSCLARRFAPCTWLSCARSDRHRLLRTTPLSCTTLPCICAGIAPLDTVKRTVPPTSRPFSTKLRGHHTVWKFGLSPPDLISRAKLAASVAVPGFIAKFMIRVSEGWPGSSVPPFLRSSVPPFLRSSLRRIMTNISDMAVFSLNPIRFGSCDATMASMWNFFAKNTRVGFVDAAIAPDAGYTIASVPVASLARYSPNTKNIMPLLVLSGFTGASLNISRSR